MAIGPSLHVDLSGLKRLERDLHAFRASAMPYATREYVNSQAFEAQRLWRNELPQHMKLRNKYTEQSIRVEKTRTLNVDRQVSVVGSIAEYMDEQEYGAKESKKGKHGVPLPAAAPGRRKLRGRVSKAKQLKAIKLMPTVSGHRSRKVVVAMAMAAKLGSPQHVFLKLARGRMGIYRIDPSKKRAAVRKVWDLSKPNIVIPENPTMGPAVQELDRFRPRLWQRAFEYQLKRHHIFGQ